MNEEDVINFYSIEAMKWQPDGCPGRCVMTMTEAKEECDWKLFTEDDIKDKVVLNVGGFYPIDELKWSNLAKRWVTIDIAPEVVRRQKEIFGNLNVDWICADIVEFEYDDKFDVVMSFSTIDHIPDSQKRIKSVEQVYELLKPDGLFLISTELSDDNVSEDIVWEHEGVKSPVHLFSVEEIKNMLQKFSIEYEVRVGSRIGFRCRR